MGGRDAKWLAPRGRWLAAGQLRSWLMRQSRAAGGWQINTRTCQRRDVTGLAQCGKTPPLAPRSLRLHQLCQHGAR